MINNDEYLAVHSTKQEMKFIDNLGKWAPELKAERSDLLAGYLRGCFKRKNWGSMNALAVTHYAANALLNSLPREVPDP